MAGNDLTEDITPIEAGLKWTIGKSRRDKCDFLGGEVGLLLHSGQKRWYASEEKDVRLALPPSYIILLYPTEQELSWNLVTYSLILPQKWTSLAPMLGSDYVRL
jgi:hypothetical protein